MYRCLYYLYLDESGESINFDGDNIEPEDLKCRFFTIGGVIVNEINIPMFQQRYESTITNYFPSELPAKFKLHYEEVRNGSLRKSESIYKNLKQTQKKSISDCIFNAIMDIPCYLLSVTIGLEYHYSKYTEPYPPLAYGLYAVKERFQYFLEEHKEEGEIVYERFNDILKNQVNYYHKKFLKNPNFPTHTNFANVRNIIEGNPTDNFMLSFADFFAFVPWCKCVSGCQRIRRYDEIKYKYYNLNHSNPFRRGNHEILNGDS